MNRKLRLIGMPLLKDLNDPVSPLQMVTDIPGGQKFDPLSVGYDLSIGQHLKSINKPTFNVWHLVHSVDQILSLLNPSLAASLACKF